MVMIGSATLVPLTASVVLAVQVEPAHATAPSAVSRSDQTVAAANPALKTRHRPARNACGAPQGPGRASCKAEVRTDIAPVAEPDMEPHADPAGFGPGDIASAYNLPTGSAGTGHTVAIIDAYDLPTAEADLAVYRDRYGLPACTTANGCFQKVDQNGGTNYPAVNAGWGQEIALDIQMVSAACPSCHILLVEARSNSLPDLGTAVKRAVTMGATEISNSYGASESSSASFYDSAYFKNPGIPITASTGDDGYGVSYPASSPWVTAVGGTSLVRSGTSRGWSEAAWSGAGSGCSSYSAKPGWQKDSGCAGRTVADVSMVADPSTGVAVYDSTSANGASGWQVFGGTSVAAPLVAGIYALAGTARATDYPASYPFASTSGLNDVIGGSSGTCAKAYLCTSVSGVDGPTGLGTPNGVAAFAYRAPTQTQNPPTQNPPTQTPPTQTPPAASIPPSASPTPGLPVAATATSSGMLLVDRANDASTEVTSYSSGSGWGGTENIGGKALGAPGVVSTPAGEVMALVRGTDNRLYAKSKLPGEDWTRWANLGSVTTGRPAAIATADQIDVFVTSSDKAVWRKSRTAAGWSNWGRIGGSVLPGTGPAAVMQADGSVALVAHTTDNHLGYTSCAVGGACANWTGLGGGVLGNPGVDTAGGQVRVYVRSTDNRAWTKAVEGTGWSRWTNFGGTLSTGPTALGPAGATATDVFALSRDGRLVSNRRTSDWGSWQPPF